MNYIEVIECGIVVIGIFLTVKFKKRCFIPFAFFVITPFGLLEKDITKKEVLELAVFFLLLAAFLLIFDIRKPMKKKTDKIDAAGLNPLPNPFYTEPYPNYLPVNNYVSVEEQKGKVGELLVFEELKRLEEKGTKFLFNSYIPKEDGTTTEIDLIAITEVGLFVIESKNYSGWIFGNQNSKKWAQTLPSGVKNFFYNPIWQNNSHCRYLNEYLSKKNLAIADKIYSYIVFSDNCEFKEVPENGRTFRIIHKKSLFTFIEEDMERRKKLFNESDIMLLYNNLYPLTQVDAATKQEHISNIHNNSHSNSNNA